MLCASSSSLSAPPSATTTSPRRLLLVSSYLLLLTFVAFNITRIGIAVIGAGLLLNFIAILANGGLMAITPETILKSGTLPDDAVVGEWLPGSKDILLERADVHLWFLTDRLVWDDISSVFRAFSIGDVIIVVGLALTLLDILLPRWGTVPEETGPASARRQGEAELP